MTEDEQGLLKKEYEYQKIKDSISQRNGTYTSPKIGEWVVAKTKFGFKRVKVLVDENCGWPTIDDTVKMFEGDN